MAPKIPDIRPLMQDFMGRSNQFIVIEGLDGSGKSTQIDLLVAHYRRKGIETRFVHFPRHNEGVFGQLITQFLRGEFGDVSQVHPQLVALLFAEDRRDFAATIHAWMDEGCSVLCDRYVHSNIAFQCAKLPDPGEKEKLRNWILNFEYGYNRIPKPDLSLYLDVPFAFTERALTARMKGQPPGYLAGAHDIHEKDFGLQRAVKQEYETLAEMDGSISRIVCHDASGAMRTIADIHQMILEGIER
jgi:dTMP kinase